MTLDDVNAELQVLASEATEAIAEMQWDEMMQELYQLWELEQYASDCADLDAQYYGEFA